MQACLILLTLAVSSSTTQVVNLQTVNTAIARCRPTGALHNPFQPEFTEYIVYANLDSHEEETQSPIVEEPSQRTELVKTLLKFPIDLDL